MIQSSSLERRTTETPLDSKDQRVVADYLRGLNSPEKRVQLGLDWMSREGASVAEALDVVITILNSVPDVLRELRFLKGQQGPQNSK